MKRGSHIQSCSSDGSYRLSFLTSALERNKLQLPLLLITVCLIAALSVLPGIAVAQDVFGRISGTVTDSQGAVVPNAKVSITDEQTKVARTVQTNDRGFYVADDIPAGTYTVGVEQQGFKTTRKTGNVLNAGGRLSVDLQLEVGATTTAIEVVAQGEAVNTVSGEISHTVDSSQVQQLALNQRNYVQLVSLIPGAALTELNQTNLTTGMSTTASSVNGRRADGNNFAVDGGFNLDSGSNASQLNNVGIDFIQEVAIKSSNFSAEYGRNAGASVNVVTRRGGESFHGGAFEYLRNEIFDAIPANNKFSVAPGTPISKLKPPLRFNDFGWNFGGPIVHKKLFFFAGEEWKRIRQLAASQNLTLPTSAELKGDFSDLLPATGPGPAGKITLPALRPPGCTLLAPNVLSPQCITQDGAAIAAVYAKMAQLASTFTNTTKTQNALFQPNNPQNWREDIVRIDYQLNDSHSIYGRYVHDDLNLIDAFGTFVPANSLPTTPTNRVRPGYGIQVAHVWIINSHLINEAKFNASWNKQRIPPTGDTWKRSTYGFQFTPPLGFGGRFPDGLPHVSFSGIGSAFPTAAPTQFTGPFFSLLAPITDISPQDNLTWTLGSHTLKFGVMYARDRKDQNSRPDSYNGRINFQSGTAVSTGVPFADALMGNFQSFSQQSADPIGHFRFNDIEAYVQDSWKVTRSLSLELGVRYENIGPTYTQGNNMTNFDPSLYVPLPNTILTGSNFTLLAPGTPFLNQGFLIDGLIRAGNGVPSDQVARVPGATSPFVLGVPAGAPRGLYRVQNYFAPRFGFSWSPFSGDNTVVRGGFGMFYDKPEGNIIFGQPGVPPFLTSVTFNNANLSNINSTGGTGAVPTIFGLSAVDPHFKNAYSMQYSFGIQHQMPFGILTELAYVGNLGRHEVRQPNINAPGFAVALANPGIATNRLRPFIGYTDINQFRSDSNSNYNALQAFASKRKGALLVTASYTWSRVLGDTGGINDNPEPECALVCSLPNGTVIPWQRFDYGRLSFDRQHIFVITYNYELPFFRNSRGVANAVLGGWEVGGITRAQTGQPLTVTASQVVATATGTNILQFTRRANFDPSAPLYSGFTCPAATKCWFNPGGAGILQPAFSVPAPNAIGNAPIANIIGPGYYNWDITIRKRFNLPREGMSLLFQTDFFNAFNRANWGNPGTSASGTPGTIGTAAPPRQLQFGLKFAF